MVSGIMGAVYFMIFAMTGVMVLVQYILTSLGYMKCMQKAGEAKWKAWVPFYNDYTMFKIVKLKGFLIIFEIITIVLTVIYLYMYVGIFSKLVDDVDSYSSLNENYVTTNRYSTNTSTNRYNYNSSKYRRGNILDEIETVEGKRYDTYDEDEYVVKFIGISVIAMLESLFGIAVFVVNIFFAIKISKAYGLGGGYIAGMILLPTIFILIIGFGKSKYIGDYKISEVQSV